MGSMSAALSPRTTHVAIEAHAAVKTDLPLAIVGGRAVRVRRRAHERARGSCIWDPISDAYETCVMGLCPVAKP